MLQEVLTELVDVHRLVIRIHVAVIESFFRDEVHDVLFLVKAYHRAVHPRLILGHQCQVRIRILKNHREELIAEDQVAFYQQGIVLLKLVLDNR